MSQVPEPPIVAEAYARAEASSIALSCEPEVGALLSLLAAAVPSEGRILELGTGVGSGLAWLVHGLGERSDVGVVTVDLDAEVQEIARGAGWPAYVDFIVGDAAERVSSMGEFDLIFADAPGGKLVGLDRTMNALTPRGVLLVDDMDLARHEDPELRAALADVREQIFGNPDLQVAEFGIGSGVILGVRRG